jgi:hypothetical protein
MNTAPTLKCESSRRTDSGNPSPFPRTQEALHDISDHPVFRDAPVAKSAGHHVAPDHAPASRGKTPEAAAVRTLERPLPGHPVLRLHENLNFDLEVREALVKFAYELPDRTVPLNLVIGAVGDIVRREEFINRLHPTFGEKRLFAASIFDASDCFIRLSLHRTPADSSRLDTYGRPSGMPRPVVTPRR